MSTTLPFPIFEKGLPLRVDDLNKMFDYLEGEALRTRTSMLGAGIFHGLEVSYKDAKLTIGKGAGVTSQGYLLQLDEDLTFSNILSEEVSVATSNFSNTDSWTDAKEDAENTIKAYELVSDKDAALQTSKMAIREKTSLASLAKDRAIDQQPVPYILVALLYRSSESRSGCATCAKGKNGSVIVRFLLLNESTGWDKLAHCKPAQPDRLGSFPYLQRFGALGDCSANFKYVRSADFNKQYETVVAPALVLLQKALDQVMTELPLFFGQAQADEAAGVLKVWKNRTFGYDQYVYDYARRLIRAYAELTERDFARSVTGALPASCFPKYLALKRLSAKNNDIQIADSDDVRPTLYRAPRVDDRQTDEARFLYTRLIEMLRADNLSFERTRADHPAELRITPSRGPSAALGGRAIPFYFNGDKMRPFWDFSKTSTGRQNNVASYDRIGEKPFDQPLLYQEAFDDADFYRVEGHVGQKLKAVLDALAGRDGQGVGLRACLNLPFSIVVVQLRDSAMKTDLNYPTLEEFAKKNPGLEHQGGVMRGGTLVIVVENPALTVAPDPAPQSNALTGTARAPIADDPAIHTVVADFCLPYWLDETPRSLPSALFTEKSRARLINSKQAIVTGFEIVFENASINAKSYEWRVDSNIVSTDQNLSFRFEFGDATLEERDFIVTLIAYGEEKQKGERDAEEINVSIRRETIKADFNIIAPEGVAFNENNGVETPLKLLSQDSETPIGITFKNLSENGVKYQWRLSRNGTWDPNPPATPDPDKNFDVHLSKGVYQVQLVAFDSANNEASVCNKFIAVSATGGEPPTGLTARSEAAPVSAAAANLPPVTALTAAQNLEKRRRLFRQRIEGEMAADPSLAEKPPYQNVLNFIVEMNKAKEAYDLDAAIDKTFGRIGEFDLSFKSNALELINDISFKAGEPVAAYRSILKSLVFFYLDKLTALQPDGLAPSTSAIMSDVLTEIKAEKSFEDDTTSDFFVKWNVRMIATAQNAPVVAQLSALFK